MKHFQEQFLYVLKDTETDDKQKAHKTDTFNRSFHESPDQESKTFWKPL